MKYRKRKQYQREVNRILKKLNKVIYEDELWKGRFYVYQVSSNYYEYEDGSGGEMAIHFRFCDKETGYYKDDIEIFIPSFPKSFSFRLNWGMNGFIVKDIDAWKDNPKRNTSINYRRVKNVCNKKEPNYYLNYENWKESDLNEL